MWESAAARGEVRAGLREGRSGLLAANIAYSAPGTDLQVLDIYRPAGRVPAGGWPVVLAIHGGGWRRFSKDQYAPKVVPTLLRGGFAVVAPNYTLSSPGNPSWPRNLNDLRQAVLWIRANGGSYGLDPGRIAAMGESAGGHLAALLGTDPGGPGTEVQAVVDFFGPTDLVALPNQRTNADLAAVQMLGPAVDPAGRTDASPVAHVSPGDPPVLILQGTADTIVPALQSREFARVLSDAGVPNRLILIPGDAHGFGFNGSGRNLAPEVLGFLHRSL
jgi:acetyl esterase/lipase